MKSALALTMIGAGSLLVYAGFKNKSVWDEILSVIRG